MVYNFILIRAFQGQQFHILYPSAKSYKLESKRNNILVIPMSNLKTRIEDYIQFLSRPLDYVGFGKHSSCGWGWIQLRPPDQRTPKVRCVLNVPSPGDIMWSCMWTKWLVNNLINISCEQNTILCRASAVKILSHFAKCFGRSELQQ